MADTGKNAVTTYTGDGSTTKYLIGFSFLDQDHVAVYIGTVLQTLGTDYTIDSTAAFVVFASAPANGTAVKIQRETPHIGQAGGGGGGSLYVTLRDGTSPSADDLDNLILQAIYYAEEVFDTEVASPGDFAGAGGSGLVPDPGVGATTRLLQSDGSWVAAPSDFTGIGTNGLVPDPGAGTSTRILLSSGSWTENTSDHGTLSGLTDDDHTQYLLADGTRDLSDSLAFSAVDKTLSYNGTAGSAIMFRSTSMRIYVNGTMRAEIAADGDWNIANSALFIDYGTGKITLGSTSDGIIMPVVAGDPSSPTDGEVWYNSSTSKLRVQAGGLATDLH